MNKFTITFTKEQLDIVMEALGELPLKRSLPVFNVINQQFVEQSQLKKEEKK